MIDTRKIRELLAKTDDHDSDERFMATNDLIKELNSVEGTMDQSLQLPVRNAILKQLNDKVSDVSTIAVKCLSILANKFHQDQVNIIVEKMCQIIVEVKEDAGSKDIFVDGIRNVIAAVDDDSGRVFAPSLLKTLLQGLGHSDHAVQLNCLDVMKDLLQRFGSSLTDLHEDLLKSLTKLMDSEDDSVRRCACSTLGPLVGHLHEAAFNSMMTDVIIKNIHGKNPAVYIQCVGVVSKTAGVRMAAHLPQIVPPLENYCRTQAATPETTVELWQNSLKAFEFIITQCPNKVTPYVDSIVSISLALMQHDPNVVVSSGAGMEDDEEEGWGDDDDDGDAWGDEDGAAASGWGDDDEEVIESNASDESWKVRLAAVHVLSAFIRARSDILKRFYGDMCDALVSRFDERDASVQEQVILTCRDLLKETVVESAVPARSAGLPPVPALVRQRSSFDTLDDKVGGMVAGLEKVLNQSRGGSNKAAFAALSQLVVVRQGNMHGFLDMLVPHILAGVDISGGLQGDALHLLHLVVELHTFEQLQSHMDAILTSAIKAVKGSSSQYIPESLQVLASISKRLPGSGSGAQVKELYSTTYQQLVVQDTSQAIKTAAIATMAQILAGFGKEMQAAAGDEVLQVFKERLGNDVSREATLQALTKIANSELGCSVQSLVVTSVPDMCCFMRQNSSKLKQSTVTCLEALIRTQSEAFSDGLYAQILSEIPGHISEADLTLSQLVLEMTSTALKVAPRVAKQVSGEILRASIKLLSSPLLQGESLRSMIQFFSACVLQGGKVPSLSYSSLLKSLLGVVSGALPQVCYVSVAQCVAGIASCDGKQTDSTVQQFVADIKSAKTPDHTKTIALQAVGEIARVADVSGHKAIDDVVFSAFNSPSSSVRQAGAFALGSLVVGNMDKFLPVLLNLIQSDKDKEYLLLCALKEAIATHSTNDSLRANFVPHLDKVAPLLFQRAESKDEGAQSMVAECLGRLCVIDVQKILPNLCPLVDSDNEQARKVVITAFRFTFQPHVDWDALTGSFGHFFKLLQDPVLAVKKEAVATVNSLMNVRSSYVSRELLSDVLLPALYDCTTIDPKYVHIRDYGNFKETIDDALPLRKAVFQCLATVMHTRHLTLDMQPFIKAVIKGLTDHEDIQIANFQLCEDIARVQPRSLLEILDTLPSVYMATVKAHLKASKTSQGERAMDCLRALVKAMVCFNNLAGVELCSKYNHFYKQICATKTLQDILAQVSKLNA